jgi:hypothetical protein
VKITMISYIKGMLVDELPLDMASEAAIPTSNHLFQVNEDTKNLDKDMAQLFHHNVTKLLFLCKQVRPNIQTAVTFLCTCVKELDIDNYKNLCAPCDFYEGQLTTPSHLRLTI